MSEMFAALMGVVLPVSRIKLFHFKITFFTNNFYACKFHRLVIPSIFSLPYNFTFITPCLKVGELEATPDVKLKYPNKPELLMLKQKSTIFFILCVNQFP